jgi:dinuclear metal center YbgI/SA1388 family protein
MTDAKTLGQALNALLQPDKFRDYGPNGLQVEGDREVRLLVSGVTASRALIEAAIAANADAILVHHGLFWRGQDGRVTGWMRERLRLLLTHGIHLFAYHLPLDAHPELGNNAQLGRVLGLQTDGCFGEQDLGFVGQGARTWASHQALADHVASTLGRQVICVGDAARPIRRVAWCTGGAQGYFEAAVAAGADAFITGEISEPQAHLARETGVAFLACGHHASERYGVPAVGARVAQDLGLMHRFIEIDNPA